MDTAQWPQEIAVKPIEEIIPNTCTKQQPAAGGGGGGGGVGERKATRPQKEQALNCPRCNSANTKFCYYNNYSLSQPRYFCKTCRRYWTEGGSLRNIPVGGGSRKNKRSSNNSSSSPTSTSSKKLLPDLVLPLHSSTQNPNKIHLEAQDLNLAFPSTQDFRSSLSEFVQLPINIENSNKNINHNMPSNSTSPSSHLSALELLTGITSSRGLNSFMTMPGPDPNSGYASGFPLHEFKPPAGFNFSVDGLGSGGYGGLQHGVRESNNSGRVLFPFEDLKQVSSTSDHMEHNRAQGDSTGYWTGMLGGGSW